MAKAPPVGITNPSAAPAEGDEKALEEELEALPVLPVGEELLSVVEAEESDEPDEVELAVAAAFAVVEVEEPNLHGQGQHMLPIVECLPPSTCCNGRCIARLWNSLTVWQPHSTVAPAVQPMIPVSPSHCQRYSTIHTETPDWSPGQLL